MAVSPKPLSCQKGSPLKSKIFMQGFSTTKQRPLTQCLELHKLYRCTVYSCAKILQLSVLRIQLFIFEIQLFLKLKIVTKNEY